MSFISNEFPEIESLSDLLPAFEFDRLIEEDATGVVYKACHRTLDRDVAIRILPRDSAADPHFRDFFQANARAMARLAHPSLIRVYDCGDLDGRLFAVTEYVRGKSLLECAHGIAIDPVQAVEIVIAVCHGLAHAHENGIVHGDIRPANILLTAKREPKIGNFGLAGLNRREAGSHGDKTCVYTAPEMLDGSRGPSPQSDVHGLGVILRELLTGTPSGAGELAKTRLVDPSLDAICRKASHPDPEARLADASALARHLDIWLTARKPSAAMLAARTAVTRRPASGQVPPRVPSRPVQAPVRAAHPPAKPVFAAPRPASATFGRQAGITGRPVLKYCMIPVLLCAAYFAHGAWQNEGGNPDQGRQDQSAQVPAGREMTRQDNADEAKPFREIAVASRASVR